MNLLTLQYFNWDPVSSIQIGNFSLHIYSLMFMVAFASGIYLSKRIFASSGENPALVDDLFVYIFIGTLLGARLGEVFFYSWDYYQNHPLEILLPIQENPNSSIFGFKGYEFTGFRGLASHGAFFGISASLLLFYYFKRKELKSNLVWLFDSMSLPVIFGGAFVRIGNFFNSEIIGKPSDLPWAVKFHQQSASYGEIVPRHPSQLYESFSYFALFGLLYLLYKSKFRNQRGFLFGVFVFGLWTIRFLVEFLKEPQGEEEIKTAVFNSGQTLSLPLMFLGASIIMASFVLKNQNLTKKV
ncbi:MAG: prolipoprotein diacylglyceryl transferase [Flavobacteriaceae bacterium]|nr:MAG: prolipoprotein diacylglyceryl transferase [Flavobacteriaceae bacterium]